MSGLNTHTFIAADPIIRPDLDLLFQQHDPIVLFDIGACEGEDSIRYQRLFPNARIHLFEPRPDNLAIIHRNLKAFGCDRITVSDLALSNQVGTATFYLSSGKPDNAADDAWDFGNKSSSLLPPSEKMKEHTSWLNFDRELHVTTARLDQYCAQHNIDHIDFIHMDVQGAELMVLQGAGAMLQRITAIWLEVEAVELYKNQPLRTDVEAFMQANSFVCVKSTVDQIAGDQLYVNRKIVGEEKVQALLRLNARLARIKRWKHRYYRVRNLLSGKK